MSPVQRRPKAPMSPAQKAVGQKIYGIVLLVGVFGMLILLDLGLVVGASATVAVPVGAVFGVLLAFNVKRVLERRWRVDPPEEA